MANIKYGRKVYRGVDKVAFRDADDPNEVVEFQLPKSSNGDDVCFYDYDGTKLYNYSKEDFLALEEMPPIPLDKPKMISEGWNWTLEEAKYQVSIQGICDIGACYTTLSGKTELDIELTEKTGLEVGIGYAFSSIDWGDGSITEMPSNTGSMEQKKHTYSSYGKYTISLEGSLFYTFNNGDIKNGNFIKHVRLGNDVYLSQYALANCKNIRTVATSKTSNCGDNFIFDSVSLRYLVCGPNWTTVEIFNTPFLQGISLTPKLEKLGSIIADLKRLVVPEVQSLSFDNYAFEHTGASYILLPSTVTNLPNTYSQSTIILDCSLLNQIPPIDIYGYESDGVFNPLFGFVGFDSFIIVPDNLYDEWINYSNWTLYPNIIKKSEARWLLA